MKLREMTNEELASWLESITPDFEGYASPVSDYFREAAARLRNVTVRSDNSAVIAELQRRLKVDEDALSIARDFTKWTAIHAENELWQTIRDKAIETEFNMNHPECAEIREKGETK